MQVLNNVEPMSDKLLDTIPALKDGEVAVFRLKNAFVKEGGREEYSCPEWVQKSGVFTIRDPYHKAVVKEKNAKGELVEVEKNISKQKIVGTYIRDYKRMGTGEAKPIYQDFIFLKGEMRLTSDRIAEYQAAMRHPENETNKYRKQMGAKKAPTFYLVGTKEITPVMQFADMQYQAEKIIREAASFQYLREMATKLNASPDATLHVKSFANGVATVSAEAMKYEMVQLAKKFPKQIMAATPDERTQVRVQIYDAQVYGVLAFEKGAYQLDTDKEFIELHKVESDKDKVDSLIDYFMSEAGTKNYTLFATTLKKALNVSRN